MFAGIARPAGLVRIRLAYRTYQLTLYVVGIAGFEPATSRPPDERANQAALYPDDLAFCL